MLTSIDVVVDVIPGFVTSPRVVSASIDVVDDVVGDSIHVVDDVYKHR